ncbi:MAG: hypothetical protein DDT23_00621 [candidate division WS2 bacterium]|nr:hypothetical protein [Candidatus Lithacetigena glycinireducens]
MKRKSKEGLQKLLPGQEIYLDDKDKKELTEEICDMVRDVINSRNKSGGFKDNLITWRKNYEMIAGEKTFPWAGASNLKEPVTEIATDATWSRLDRSLLAYSPLFLVSPYDLTSDDLKLSARKYEHFIDFDIRNNIKPMKVLSDFLFCCTLDGVGVLKVNWLTKAYQLLARRGRKIIIYNSPQISLIDILDMFFPIHAKTIDDSWAAQRIWLSYYDVLIRKERFGYKIPPNLGDIETKDDKDDYEREIDDIEGVQGQRYSGRNPYDNRYPVVEWWGTRRIGTKFVPIVATVFLRERHLARIIVNPFFNLIKPFVIGSGWPRPNRIIGRGMGQKLMHLQSEIDTIHNQRIDKVTLKLAPIFKQRRGALSPDEQEFYPLKFFEMEDLNDVQEWILSDVPFSSYQEERLSHSLAEKSSGVSDYTLGRESSVIQTRATARGTLAIIQEGDKKFDKAVQNISVSFVELMQKLDVLYKENLNDDIPIPELKDILTPEEIAERYVFEFKPSKLTINKEVRQQKEMQMFAMLMDNPLMAGNVELLIHATKELLHNFEKPNIAQLIDESDFVRRLVEISRVTQEISLLQGIGNLMQLRAQLMALQQGTPPMPAPGGAPPPGGPPL